MNFEVRKSFVKDAARLPSEIQNQLAEIISTIEKAKSLSELKNCKKIKGNKTAFRIRLHQYRIGFFFDNGVIELVRVLSRKDIYKYFP